MCFDARCYDVLWFLVLWRAVLLCNDVFVCSHVLWLLVFLLLRSWRAWTCLALWHAWKFGVVMCCVFSMLWGAVYFSCFDVVRVTFWCRDLPWNSKLRSAVFLVLMCYSYESTLSLVTMSFWRIGGFHICSVLGGHFSMCSKTQDSGGTHKQILGAKPPRVSPQDSFARIFNGRTLFEIPIGIPTKLTEPKRKTSPSSSSSYHHQFIIVITVM